MSWYSGDWPAYVPVAERRRAAARLVAKMRKAGRKISPVVIEGRKIAGTFWGDSWCKNLESYSDYENRMPRGRSYVRNDAVIDLQIKPGRVNALVSGSALYEVEIKIKPLAKRRWTDLKGQCVGKINTLVELLQGSISKGVMQVVTRKDAGLFPAPREIAVDCSCPDWATMCKHVAATLYGVGARFDQAPELLFRLRGVDPAELVEAAVGQPHTGNKAHTRKVLAPEELSSVFGIDIDMKEAASTKKARAKKKATVKKAAASRKPAAKKVTTTRATGSRTHPGKKKIASKKSVSRPSTRSKAD